MVETTKRFVATNFPVELWLDRQWSKVETLLPGNPKDELLQKEVNKLRFVAEKALTILELERDYIPNVGERIDRVVSYLQLAANLNHEGTQENIL